MKLSQLVVACLLIVSGVVLWFVLGGDPAPAPAPSGAPPAVGERGPGADPAEAAKARAASADDGRAAAAGAERTEAPELLPPEPERESAKAMLRGRLVDREGQPRVGVELAADVWTMDVVDVSSGSAPGGRRSKATTDDEGRFELHVPKGEQGSFELLDSALVFAESQQFRGASSDQELGDLLVLRAGRIAGVVQDEHGAPIADVRVEAHLGALGIASQSTTTTAEDGTFSVGRLRPGKWTLRTASSSYLPANEPIELAPEEQRTGLVVVVHEGLSIAGRVIDERGVGVAGMKVVSQRAERVGAVEMQRFSGDEATITDAQGRFTLAGLEGEQATVRAYGDGHSSVTQRDVAVGTASLELRVQRLASIAGELVTTEGAPIAGSRVTWAATEQNRGAVEIAGEFVDLDFVGGNGATTTDERGRFVLENVRPGVVTVRARGDTHVPTRQDGVRVLPAQRVEGIRLRADVGAVAQVEVVDARGEPIEGAKVEVVRASNASAGGGQFEVAVSSSVDGGVFFPGGRALGTGETNARGVATIMGLPGCDAVVRAKHADYAPSEDQPIVLPAKGTVAGRLALGDPGFLEVTVVRADGAAAVGVEVGMKVPDAPGGTFVETGKTDQQGVIRFGPLAAGDYVAMLSRGVRTRDIGGMQMVVGAEREVIESSARDVTVRGGSTATIELAYPVMTRLTGRVLGVDGPLAGCTVELERSTSEGAFAGFGGPQTKTDADGGFTFEEVESGDYTLHFGKPGQVVKAEEPLTVPADTPELHRELLLRTGRLRVALISDDDAEPIERAEVRLVRGGADGAPREQRSVMMMSFVTTDGADESTSMMTVGDERVVTDEDGVAVFEDVPVGTYTLKVEHRRHAPLERADLKVTERQETDCGTLTMQGAGQIRGVVDGADGKRVAMALVEYRELGADEWGEREMAFQGAFRLTGLKPGRYELRARRVGPVEGEPGDVATVQVEAGKVAAQDLKVHD